MPPERNGMLTIITAGLFTIGTIGGGVWTMEARYAKESELLQHVQAHAEERKAFNADIVETRRQVLRKSIFDLEQVQKFGKLTRDEQRYLDELRQQYQEATERLQGLRR